MSYGRPHDGGQQEIRNFNGFGDFRGSREDLRYMDPTSRGDQGAGEAHNYGYRPSHSHGPGINPHHLNPRYQGRHDQLSGRNYGLPVQEKGDEGFDPFKKPHLYQSTASYDGRTRVFENSTLRGGGGGSFSKGQTHDVKKNFVSQSAYQNMNPGFPATQGRPPVSFPGKLPSCAPQYDNKNKQDNKVESKVKVDQKVNGQTTNPKLAPQPQHSKLDPKVKVQQKGNNSQDASRKKIHANLYQVLKPDSSIDETDVSDKEVDDSGAEKRKVAPPNVVKKPSAPASNTPKPPPSQMSKDEKKKQKKENQKARARETEKNKLKEYLIAAENEVSKKKFSSALSLIFKAFNCNPSAEDSLRLYQVRIKIYLTQNKHELVLKDAKKVLEIDSSNVECLKHISSSCLKSGDVEEWNLFYQRFKGSSKIVDEAQKNMSRLEKLASDAMNMESEKKYSEAVGAVEQCLKISPNSENFLCWKARLYSMLKDFDMADKAFAKLDQVIQGTKSWQTSLAKGIYFFYLWKPEAAYNHLLEAQKVESKEADEWFKRIREMRNMYNKIKQACDTGVGYVHAIRLAKEALEMAPDNDEFLFALHMRRANLNDRYAFDKEEAIADINRAIGIKNRDSYCYFMRGTLNLDLDNLEAAVEDLKQAINISRKTEYVRKLKEAEDKIKKRNEKKRRDSERAAFSAAASGNTHYDILGVARTASSQEIRTAYKEKAKYVV